MKNGLRCAAVLLVAAGLLTTVHAQSSPVPAQGTPTVVADATSDPSTNHKHGCLTCWE
ncbi:hypothetical protein ACFW1A_04925 [Kitasatospora sp. NPDC058965]|uniref:hypothetical protein n=1 Tax=Kitasatospora sp. NPDC058965 TaxID=3346682 RepID=UPI00367A42BB